MSTQDLNYEQPTVSDAAVDNSDDYTEYTFSTTKGMRFALIVTYIQYTILAKNDCMEVKTFPKKANKMPVVRYDDIATMHVKKVYTWYHICWAIICCWTIIFPFLFLHFGSNYKLEITLKSGAKTSVCASNKNVMTHIFRTFATFKTLKLLFKEKTLYEIGH